MKTRLFLIPMALGLLANADPKDPDPALIPPQIRSMLEAAIASELSEDPRSKGDGGKLGWMTRDRLPADFAVPIFSLPLDRPSLVRTKLGWHLVEVTARKASEPREFAEARDEVCAAMQTVKRREALTKLRKALRESGGGSIEVLDDTFAE